MVLGLPRLGVFRVFDRDQVMYETDEPRATVRPHALEYRPFFQMVMRNQEVDGRGRARAQTRVETAFTTGEQATPDLPRQPTQAEVLPAVPRLAAPSVPDSSDKLLRKRTRQPSQPADLVQRGKTDRGIAGKQVLGIGQLDAINPRRRFPPGAREQPGQVENDHQTPIKPKEAPPTARRDSAPPPSLGPI